MVLPGRILGFVASFFNHFGQENGFVGGFVVQKYIKCTELQSAATLAAARVRMSRKYTGIDGTICDISKLNMDRKKTFGAEFLKALNVESTKKSRKLVEKLMGIEDEKVFSLAANITVRILQKKGVPDALEACVKLRKNEVWLQKEIEKWNGNRLCFKLFNKAFLKDYSSQYSVGAALVAAGYLKVLKEKAVLKNNTEIFPGDMEVTFAGSDGAMDKDKYDMFVQASRQRLFNLLDLVEKYKEETNESKKKELAKDIADYKVVNGFIGWVEEKARIRRSPKIKEALDVYKKVTKLSLEPGFTGM
jgi:hypothetical protein